MTIVARLVRAHDAFNAINVPTVQVYMQLAPGVPGVDRGIESLEYRVMADGVEVQSGRTGSNGRIEVRIAPGVTTILNVLGSEYEVTLLGSLHPVAQLRGVQQRLELLGYFCDNLHGDNRAMNTFENPDVETEHAMLDFQADNELFADAMFGNLSVQKLNRVIRNVRGE